jgi:hypothetical protein
LLRDPVTAAEMGQSAQSVIRTRHTADVMAEETLALYRRLLAPRAVAR